MPEFIVELTVLVEVPFVLPKKTIMHRTSSARRIREVVMELLELLKISEDYSGWQLVFQGQLLPYDKPIGSAISQNTTALTMVLQKESSESTIVTVDDLFREAPTTGIEDGGGSGSDLEATSMDSDVIRGQDPHGGGSKRPATPTHGDTDLDDDVCDSDGDLVNDSDLESSDFDQALDDAEVACAEEATVVEHAALEEADAAEAFDEEDEEEKPTPKKSKPGLAKPADATEPSAARAGSQVIRRATVRYYDRMNPERAHPLLITITKKMVEKVVKANTNQKSTGPVKVNLAEAVEIEPIIPGCACFPPKITTWLDRKDFVATFYVVPQVLGTIEGAVVLIRQNHVPIAEIRIDGKVVKRTWVVLSGFATICLPFVSAVAKHYQVDFNSQIGDGFNLYLTIIQAVLASLAYVPPWSLLVAFFFLTMLLYWFSRARTKDVFFEVKTVGPQRELARISKLAQSDPDTAAQELLELLRIYPNYQPAHIFYAEWHYKWKSYEHAVDGYEEAFKLKSARAIDYLRASLAASHLGNVEKALEILQLAETLLPDESIPGVMFFNMGCYHAKIGRHAVAVQCLKRALRAGFRKKESYLKDRDLDSLRSRSDFRELLERVKKEKV